MRSFLWFFLIAVLAATITSCAEEDEESPFPGQPRTIIYPNGTSFITTNLVDVTTVGNHSYVRIDREGNPDEYAREVLELIEVFQCERPKLEILDWKIEKRQTSFSADAKIFGLWIDHRPKEMKE